MTIEGITMKSHPQFSLINIGQRGRNKYIYIYIYIYIEYDEYPSYWCIFIA